MANFQLTTKNNYYIGASTDTKPTSCNNGSRCYEYDTRKWYITNDSGTTWNEMQDMDALVLGAGSAIIGKVGIDQTTPGTTNGVQVNAALPAGDNNIGNVDIASALPAGTNVIGKTGHDVTGITSGTKVVTTAGTAEALCASTPCKYVILTALATNTDRMVYGGSTAKEATNIGTPLYVVAGIPQSQMIPCDNAADIYLDAGADGEGVSYNILT